MRGIEDRHFLVTGGGSGIGRATAEHLVRHGARVSVLDKDGDAAAKVVRSLDSSGTRAIALPCDVTHEGDLVDAIARADHELGDLCGAVTSAGINIEEDRVPLDEMTPAAFARIASRRSICASISCRRTRLSSSTWP